MQCTYCLLVVEDNPTDVMMLKRALVEHEIDHKMVVIDDGDKAVEYLRNCSGENRPDLIVIDLNLPTVDGLEVLRECRFRPMLVQTRMVVLTSSEASGDRKRAELLGVDAYIRKPINVSEFIEIGTTIRRLLESSAGLQSTA